ncbi:rRNA-processing protein SAS10 [Spizellomyces punctatus DAOM BR117]|uniref:Sas10 C-terminal domain-containing protein n=1 Tax=Spizellomyces punctatus (strain DAOM BR117) TaxID=645134 RepID=A0A0L0H8V5_SPIPD|nr:rRNA-processing protein SAS10 [Spizellomyces punctatus DAOM BR117]KNC97083.1 hypothetical protein SPPG_07478 [Spizellomyces punctatus DAOM BR117]|eukprot:XP_016605123.1 hypothetical protein SPPG_07478 [Spizellomyces punctatus DAOM BR117]
MARRKRTRVQRTEPQQDVDYRKGASADLQDLGLDSEDEFHDQREKITLDESLWRGRRGEEDEEGDEEVFGLDVGDSDEEDEEEEEDEDEQLLKKVRQSLRKGAEDSESEGEEDEEGVKNRRTRGGDDEFDDRAWGKSRKMYYDADEASDQEDAKEEEQEALRLQKLRASQIREQDFIDDFADSFLNRLSSGAGESSTAVHLDKDEQDDDLDHLAISTSLPLHLLPSTQTKVEVVSRDESKLSVEELERIAESSIPDVVQLLGEFTVRWEELRDVIGPALKWHCRPENAIRTGHKGERARQYLELKYRILVTYLTNISFYLSLRANPPPGSNIKAHPVVESLVQMQEFLSVLETKVEGRVSDDDSEGSDEEGVRRKKRRKRRQQVRGLPGLMADVESLLANGVDAIADEEQDLSAEDDAMDMAEPVDPVPSKLGKKKTQSGTQTNGSIEATEPPSKKKFKAISIPEVEFVPLSKPKKSRVKSMSNDFGESNDIDLVDLEDKLARKKSLKFHVTRVDQAIASRQARLARSAGGDEDIPYRDRNGKVIQPASERPTQETIPADLDDDQMGDMAGDFGFGLDDDLLDNIGAEGEDDEYDLGQDKTRKRRHASDEESDADEEEDPLAYYEHVKQSKKARKEQREAEVMQAKLDNTLDDSHLYDENDLGEGAKRPASYKIITNKGLTPYRKKERRNPRVMKRLRYEKAVKRLGSFKRVAVDKSSLGAYEGEKTGIKANLARSVRFAA